MWETSVPVATLSVQKTSALKKLNKQIMARTLIAIDGQYFALVIEGILTNLNLLLHIIIRIPFHPYIPHLH